MDSQIDLLKRLIAEGQKFTFTNFSYRDSTTTKYGGEDTPEWLAWKTRATNLVRRLASDHAPGAQLIQQANSIGTRGNGKESFERAKATYSQALQLVLDAILEDTFGELRAQQSTSKSPILSNRVFIVHGHDHALKTDLEAFLHQIGLEAVVLHRQPDKGQTIIEKFEEHADVGYAFVLLTPDDIAYTSDQDALPDASRSKEGRARQNVIFEFGYFVGRLGRDRVCCIFRKGVILPSDLTGLIYKEVETSVEPQGLSIIRELKAAGYSIKL